MTGFMTTRFEVSSYDLRVPAAGGFRGTAVPAHASAVADGPAEGAFGLRGGERLGAGYGHALRQRPVVADALISNPPVSGLLPVRRQVLTS